MIGTLTRETYKEGERNMLMTARDVFSEAVRVLPPTERLRLAALILDDLTQSNQSVIDNSDTWSAQDRADLTTFSLLYAATIYPEDEEIA